MPIKSSNYTPAKRPSGTGKSTKFSGSTNRKSTSKSNNKSVALEVDKNTSVNVRKIENGFVVSESGYVGKGRNQRYESKEYFSPTNPVAGVKTSLKFGKK